MPLDEVLPYYHPTTVVLLDDNESFLKSFSLQLPEKLSWLTFTSARRCLDYVNATPSRSLEDVCLSLYRSGKRGNNDLLSMDLTLIEQEIANPERFSNISVLMVDYDMPVMDGLEFCRSIENPRIRKILLTGVADEKIAVSAFNDGLIHRYFQKSAPDIIHRLNSTIAEMQRAYFQDTSRFIQSALAMKSPDFFHDPAFVATFEAITQKYNVVEYYYVEAPRGILMVSEQGALYRLVIFSDQDLEHELFQLRQHQAPASVTGKVSAGSHIPCLWVMPEHPAELEEFDWESCLYPARQLRGAQRWRYALIPDPPAYIEYDPESSSYARFLARASSRHL